MKTRIHICKLRGRVLSRRGRITAANEWESFAVLSAACNVGVI